MIMTSENDSSRLAPLIVAKVGSNAITTVLGDGTQSVDPQKVAEIAYGINIAREGGYRVILVTSGAVAGGMYKQHFAKRPGVGENTRLSSLAAIGQTQLMHLYSEAFEKHDICVAQGLPTQDDFHRAVVHDHMRDTLNDLLSLGVVPILNENDFTSFAEMRFGDNDTIAALVAILCEAQHLVLFTVEDGIMSANTNHDEHAVLVEEINDLNISMFDEDQEKSAAGSGGINSKLFAGDIARYSGIQTSITHVDSAENLLDVVSGNLKCSRFFVREIKPLSILDACEIVKIQSQARENPFFDVGEYLSNK